MLPDKRCFYFNTDNTATVDNNRIVDFLYHSIESVVYRLSPCSFVRTGDTAVVVTYIPQGEYIDIFICTGNGYYHVAVNMTDFPKTAEEFRSNYTIKFDRSGPAEQYIFHRKT